MDLQFFKDKRILITGHTGFKGSWLCKMLDIAGAELYGYSLDPPTQPNLFELANLGDIIKTKIGDISDFSSLKSFFETVEPEFVIHLAAQPLVRESYERPLETYRSNVMGTACLMECIRLSKSVKSVLNVTTDKVYNNFELDKYYKESDPLDGFDPYSNSKSCSELITHCYIRSFFSKSQCVVSTARAGNVIGGGDFAKDRIIPDCVRAGKARTGIQVRNPNSIRPYQHVLEPLSAYLTILSEQSKDSSKAGCYNVGPRNEDCVTTSELVTIFCNYWGNGLKWQSLDDSGPHEANFLKLDSSHIKEVFGFEPKWHISEAVKKTVEWSKSWLSGEDVSSVMERQIVEYLRC